MFKIALRNIFRNPRRSLLTGMSIMFAVMIVIYVWSFVNGIVDGLFDGYVRSSTGHVRLMRDDYYKREKMLPLEKNINDYAVIEKAALANKKVVMAAGRIKFGVLLSQENKNKPIIGIGVAPSDQERISGLSRQIVQGRAIQAGTQEINIGSGLARDMGYKVGDSFLIITQTAYGSIAAMELKIVGIFSTGIYSQDNRQFYIPLDQAQKLLDMEGRVTEIFLLIKDPKKAPGVAVDISATLKSVGFENIEARPWQDQGVLYIYMIIAKSVYSVIYFVILLMASFTILNTMFMAVLERTKEIGVMKAMGMKDRQIVGLMVLEAAVLGAIASAIGAVFGTLIAYYLSVKGIDFSSTFSQMPDLNMPLGSIYRAKFSWVYVAEGFFFGVLFSVLASIPPARRAAKLEPTEALHET